MRFPSALYMTAMLLLLPLHSDAQPSGTARELSDAATLVNNEGVEALKQDKWQLAFDKFNAALKLDPDYKVARENLAIAHSNYGLNLGSKHKLDDALWQFHAALYLAPDNENFQGNVRGLASMQGFNPAEFKERVRLGDQAKLRDDLFGAIVEYQAALKARDDNETRRKLDEVSGLLKAKGEYAQELDSEELRE